MEGATYQQKRKDKEEHKIQVPNGNQNHKIQVPNGNINYKIQDPNGNQNYKSQASNDNRNHKIQVSKGNYKCSMKQLRILFIISQFVLALYMSYLAGVGWHDSPGITIGKYLLNNIKLTAGE